MHVLSKVSWPVCIWALCGTISAQAPQVDTNVRPSGEQQAAMLAVMGRYAEQYLTSLPNFLCLQATEQFEGNKKGEHWHKGDTLTSRLAYSDGHERRTLEEVNNKPVQSRTKGWRRPLSTEGEFGPMMAEVFSDSASAAFDWNRWDTIKEHPVAVFDYKVDKEHSALKLGASESGSAIVPFHGSVYADPASGEVYRIINIASDIPTELPQREAATTIDYDYVNVGANRHLLPAHVTSLMKTDRNSVRNESEFRSYQKFEAESTLKFGSENQSDSPRKQ